MKTKMKLEDVDTGQKLDTTIETPAHARANVRITFGHSFSVELSWAQASLLSEALYEAVEESFRNSV